MKKFFNQSLLYKVMALAISILLFTYVNVGKLSSVRENAATDSSLMATKKETIKVPLQINADMEKYFITGYPSEVSIKLEGPSSLVTTTVNTQNFKVVANLTDLGEGQHKVQLKVQGLNSELTYSLKPDTITVTIEKRKTKTFEIETDYNKKTIADGYSFGTPSLGATEATVSGATSTVNSISRIVAKLNLTAGITKDVEQTVSLQALDESGNVLNVVIDPATVKVKIPVTADSKSIDLKFEISGTGVDGYTYELQPAVEKATIKGPVAILNKLSSLTTKVDVSGIKESVTKTITLDLPAGTTSIAPETVLVKVTVTKVASDTTSETASSSSTSSASDSSSSSSSASSSSTSGSSSE